MDFMCFLWLGLTILAAIVEAIVPALVSIWFVPGGLLALIACLAGGPLWLQILLFLAGSAAALFITRPLAKRLQKQKPDSTNADRVIGAAAVVTQEIDNLQATGRVSVMGNSWAARSQQEKRIPTGETVKILRIEGVKLIVAPCGGEKLEK